MQQLLNLAANAEKAAKDQEIEGAKPASVVFAELESRSSEKRVFNTSIKGTRTDLRIYGDSQTVGSGLLRKNRINFKPAFYKLVFCEEI